MKIGYLGVGAWGFCLAHLLAMKGHSVVSWTHHKDLVDRLNHFHEHPFLPGYVPHENMQFTTKLEDALEGAEILVEAVTSKGIRPVFETVKKIKTPSVPIVITSKGIEQNTGLILPDVVIEVLGKSIQDQLGILSGPSFALEVIEGLPASVVASAYVPDVMKLIGEVFMTDTFRVYPNSDLLGVSYGGALKNVIAIACGISDGLSLGHSSKAALITRGLNEMRKLAVARGCKAETIYGLSGLGDICLTASSLISRNFRFGHLLAQNVSPKDAQEKIGMVVEGAYTAVSALQLSKQLKIEMPITESIYKIIYENMNPMDAVKSLMKRVVKEEHL